MGLISKQVLGIGVHAREDPPRYTAGRPPSQSLRRIHRTHLFGLRDFTIYFCNVILGILSPEVIIVEPNYENMYVMFEKDSNAKRYFNGLPDYVREQISSRANSVNTYAGLRDYAENLLRGDD